jgi:hypothetical protein
MPRKKLTPEEIRAKGKELHAQMVYYAAHPKEREKADQLWAKRHKQQVAKAMAKHLPEATGISDNGEYVHVAFTRNDGERVVGIYKRVGWDYPPATEWDQYSRPARRRAAPDAARENPRPDPEEKPRS